jgi:NADH-quinone oxidoreductase E subunit
MAHASVAIEFVQPDSFKFTEENFKKAEAIIARYPQGRQQSAVMPLLTLAQQQHDGWIPRAAIDYIASILTMPSMKVLEVASFYTMYNLQPMGKYHVQVCGTTPCMLRGAEDVVEALKTKLGVELGGTTSDGLFTLTEVECLGACVNAPMMQVTACDFDGYYEDLTPHTAQTLIDELAAGVVPKVGPNSERSASEPATGLTTLQDAGAKAQEAFNINITQMEDDGLPSEVGEKAAAAKAKKKPTSTRKKGDA